MSARPVVDATRQSWAGLVSASTWGPRRTLRRFVTPVAVLGLWHLASTWPLVDPSFVPPPATVLQSWWQWMFGERAALSWYSGTWFEYVYLSARRVALGFGIAALMGVSVGVLVGWYELAADLIDPLVQWLRPIPMTAWLPFATFLFGIREGAAVFLIAMGAFYPIVVNATAGAEQTPKLLVRAALMLGTPPRRMLLRVVLPSALPSIFVGLRLGIGIGWVLVIVVEMLAVKGGIGYAMWTAYQFVRIDLILAAMFTVGLLGLLSDRLIVLASRRLLRWSTGLRAR